MRLPLIGPLCVASLMAAQFCAPSQAAVLDFEGFGLGRVIDDEYAGVAVSGKNGGVGPDAAITFDTANPTGGDYDLGGPFSSPHNDALSRSFDPGNVLIIQEQDTCDFGAGYCREPDDTGGGGVFNIEFDSAVRLESIDFFDIEFDEDNANPDSEIHLFDASGAEIQAGTFFVPFTGGDNTWNQLSIGVGGVKRLQIELAGSGAIDNIVYASDVVLATPVPAAGLLFFSGLMGLGVVARAKGR
jgi:hypothetical protein